MPQQEIWLTTDGATRGIPIDWPTINVGEEITFLRENGLRYQKVKVIDRSHNLEQDSIRLYCKEIK